MDSKSANDMEHKYDDSKDESCDWIASPSGIYVSQGRIPTKGTIIPINIIEEETKTQRSGKFYAEEKDGEIRLIQVVENQHGKIIYRLKPEPIKDSLDDKWNRQFEANQNTKLLDEMIQEWGENEEYIEIEIELKHKSGSNKGKSSETKRKIVKRPLIKTVKDKFYVAKGSIQSGKSQFMMDGALKCLKNGTSGKSSIIIFQQSGHLIQFKERLDTLIQRIKTNIPACPIPLNSIIARDENFSTDDFLEALQGRAPKIFLIIGNDKQAGLLNQKFKKAARKIREEIMNSYVLWIDEADHVDSGTEAKKTISLNTLKKYSYATVEVSATVLDITGREDVKPDHLRLLYAPSGYRGVPSFSPVITEEEATYAFHKTDNLLRSDKGLKRIVREFVENESPTWCPVWNSFHPCIMLVNNGKTVEPKKKLIVAMKRRHPDLTTIVYIGEGLYIHHPELPATPFSINNHKSSITMYGHLFKGISPSTILLWLKRNGGVSIFHHILIASADLAGRSISYACLDKDSEMPYWHLTHHRLVLPKNSACPTVLQKCRLCTTFESNIPLKLYVSEKDEKAVIKSYWSQEEIIERSKHYPNMDYLKTIMANLELLGGRNGKIPSGRALTIDKKLKACKKVKGDDGGLSLSSYKFDGLIEGQRKSVSQKLEHDRTERKELENRPNPVWKKELGRLERNIKNALNRNDDTIIIRILRHFKSLDQEGIDAVVDLNTLCRLGVSDKAHYTQWTTDGTSRGQYKILTEQHSGFSLNPEIRQLISLV
jgi:hypothetical protein